MIERITKFEDINDKQEIYNHLFEKEFNF